MTEYIEPWEHQIELAEKGLAILREHAIVYLAMEERTGKTLTAILIAEEAMLNALGDVLVITKPKALKDWESTLIKYPKILSRYTVTTYGKAKNLEIKDKERFKLVILDEPHAFVSAYPKATQTWIWIKRLCIDMPIIYISATPHAQGSQLLYHQLALSCWSPWVKFKDFYQWFKKFADRDKKGMVKTKYVGHNQQVIDYEAIKHDEVLKEVKHLFVTKTRQELGFEQEPEDVIHYVELDENTKTVYNMLLTDKVIEFTHSETGKEYVLVCDSTMKLRSALHMLEGGVLKLDKNKEKAQEETYLVIRNREKIDYVLDTWGDSDDLVIMYNYKGEGEKLREVFKNAEILQASSYAEGVDLSMYQHLVIYSQDFSTAKHSQRRARQANKNRTDPINVHFLLVKRAISEQVYKTVSKNKKNFVDSVFERTKL